MTEPASDGSSETPMWSAFLECAGLPTGGQGTSGSDHSWRHGALGRNAEQVPRDRAADRKYLLIVGAEMAAAGLGAALLVAVGGPAFVPVLVGAGLTSSVSAGQVAGPEIGLLLLGYAVAALLRGSRRRA